MLETDEKDISIVSNKILEILGNKETIKIKRDWLSNDPMNLNKIFLVYLVSICNNDNVYFDIFLKLKSIF